MRIEQINNTNFGAGNVILKNMRPEQLCTFDSIKKIAEEKGIDVFITQKSKPKYPPLERFYTVIASKTTNTPVKKNKTVKNCSFAILNPKACIEEASARIFNAVTSAIEGLEKKINNL